MSKSNKFDQDDLPSPRANQNCSFNDVLNRRMSRRTLLNTTAMLSSNLLLGSASVSIAKNQPLLNFKEIAHGLDEYLHLGENYSAQVLLRWGDSLFNSEITFDPNTFNAKLQKKCFGYNNDFVAYLPAIKQNNSSTHGLLVVNHEYVNSTLMHPGSPGVHELTRSQIDTEMAAHGLSVVEIQKENRNWRINYKSSINRRITPLTKMKFSGPAKGHKRVKTEFSSQGEMSLGTFGNCAGSITPWGTVLTAEENIQFYYSGNAQNTVEHENYKRFGLYGNDTTLSYWGKFYEQWNLDKHPQAAMHAGWIVELDPYDPTSTPVKRTALGRCKHEGCDVHINKDGKAVLYMGDDQVFEYIYRFVSKQKFQVGDQENNSSLLDSGELSVAQFMEDGRLIWRPLQYGIGPHTKKNGFMSQADVVLDMRKAADLVGATPMDRPEEIKVNPISGNVFAMLTNNIKRDPLNVDAANPRILNRHGHIIELTPPEQDHSASEYQWEVFVLAGNPDSKLDNAYYPMQLSENGWFSCPDNCSFDRNGNLWIATDGFNRSGKADGVWVSATVGEHKKTCKQFLRAPIGAEVCSPCFTPDYKTMFCSIQHPGSGSTFDQPSTRWPDFEEGIPPRPAVIAVMHDQDEEVGS